MPLGELHGIGPGTLGRRRPGARSASPSASRCSAACSTGSARRSTAAAHRDGEHLAVRRPPHRPTPLEPPADRPSASRLGVRALDALIPCGRGQRLGIFAGSGVGKSSLLGMIARAHDADVNVIALVGERGREVREFVERDLGEALERSVVVVATSDQPALVRIRAAFTATAIAEYFRDAGSDVLLMMDSRHAVRDGPARGRARDRRAAGDPRLHAERVRAAAEAARARGHEPDAARSPASTPCSSRATT